MPEWKPIRAVLVADDLGPAGWEAIHARVRLHQRKHRQAEVVALLRYALYCHLVRGDNVELNEAETAALFSAPPSFVESVA
jgi:hypothetical protein